MAAVPAVTAFLLIISLTAGLTRSESHHVLVRPSDSDSSVCGSTLSCDTLSNFISNQSIFKMSNSVIQFLTGKHQVNMTNITQLLVQEISNISLYGNSTSESMIHCESPLAFVFINVKTLQIKDLKFSQCGHSISKNIKQTIYVPMMAAIILSNVTDFSLRKIEICRSKGYGLLGINIRGINEIHSAIFKENNANCTSINEQSHGDCVGGNAAFHFNTTKPLKQKKRKEVSLLIQATEFSHGTDFSIGSPLFNCTDLNNKSMTRNPKFRANGLLITAGQNNYRVDVNVSNTTFTGNTGNYLHPAVWVHDYSGVVNNSFSFVNCDFNAEGAVRISNIYNNQTCRSCTKSSLCYAYDGTNRNRTISFVSLISCRFLNGRGLGVEICVEPTSVRYAKFQNIVIADSQFQNYQVSTTQKRNSVVSIEYVATSQKYQSIAIEVTQSVFSHNHIPLIQCHLLNNTYSEPLQKNNYKYLHLLTLRDSTFEHNVNQNLSTVWINTQEDKAISIWEYENTTNRDKNNKNVTVVKISRCTFRNNTSSKRLGTIRVDYTYITLDNSIFESCIGTALHAFKSVVRIEGLNTFIGNNGTFGGALNLNKSRIFITSGSHTEITNNIAEYGGGIFAIAELISWKDLTNYRNTIYNRCTFSHEAKIDLTSIEAIRLTSNKATIAGDSIFGGTYSRCRFSCLSGINKCNATSKHFKNAFPKYIYVTERSKETSRSEVACPPSKLCICEGEFVNQNNCINHTMLTGFPGQTFNITLIAMGELNASLTAAVSSTICKAPYSENNCRNDFQNDIGYGQRLQKLTQKCTNVTYTINSDSTAIIELSIDYDKTPNTKFEGIDLIDVAHFHKFASKVAIQVNFTRCPVGFLLHNSQPARCICLDFFRSKDISCNIGNGTVNKPRNMWIFSNNGTTTVSSLLINRTIVHQRCPLDYCISKPTAVNLSTPDEQCNYNRSGILCGMCPANLSLVLGTSNCKKCSNVYLLLIIPFALAGVALVALLLKCNLTVSTGHINGIIFYANIVQVNKPLLFPNQGTPYKIFAAFIAWLNLDLGIETCFFQNMDSYAKVWLQFVFPVYLWIMIGLIIVAAKHSSRVGRLTGKNSVPVLATLFLFSYAKLLRAIIATVYFTYIDFEDESYSTVWKVDGNVKYFSPKHTILFLVALLFALCYILPLTLLVLFAPCLQAKSHLKAFKWVNRLKPFLDAYQGPYSDKFRYWTGLMLIFRILLLFAFATNFENDPSMNFFWTIVGIGPVAVFVIATRKVYRQKLANFVEALSLLNVVLLCSVNWLTTTTVYMKLHPIQEYSTYISICIALTSFMFIVLYQLALKVCPVLIVSKKKEEQNMEEFQMNKPRESNENNPTTTVVDLDQSDCLKEPLLDAY